MKSLSLVGRSREISILKEIELSPKSEFVAVYGRRRIGKTFLIEEYFKNRSFYLEFIGTENALTSQQVKSFVLEIERVLKPQIEKPKIANWSDAFNWLRDIVESSTVDPSSKKVIFFDELPWLASKKSQFMQALSFFWNQFAKKRSDIILVVCGSAASWMIKHTFHSKGGLYKRVTKRIPMSPFNLRETEEYLKAKGISLIREQIIDLYMVTGGVALYLDEVKAGESAAQFTQNNYFAKGGILKDEFDPLFRSLFDDHKNHIEIVRLLAKNESGLSKKEIEEKLQVTSGGRTTDYLKELEKSDFIHFNPKLGAKKREGVYRLVDEFCLFYLNWVEPAGNSAGPDYWQRQIGLGAYNRWAGHAFENVCFKHADQIKTALGISGTITQISGLRTPLAQIDMIIDRNDKAVNLCEMKYTIDPFEMSDSEAKKINVRKSELASKLKRKKNIFVTIVTPQPAVQNAHYTGLNCNQINLPALFS